MRHSPAPDAGRTLPPQSSCRARAQRPSPVGRGFLLLATGALALTAAPAVAHDALLDSDPADAAVLTVAPAQVVLTFAANQSELGAQIVVTGPDGENWSDGDAVVSGTSVTQQLRAGMVSGTYEVLWRSVAGDGHPVSGELTFVLDLPVEAPEPAAPEPAEVEAVPAADDDAPSAAPVTDEGRASPLRWLGAGVLVLVVGLGALLIALRRSGGGDE